MYALRGGNVLDFTFAKKKKKMRVKKLLFGVGCVPMAFCCTHIFYSNINNSRYFHLLSNFGLPQLQDFFNTLFENGSF